MKKFTVIESLRMLTDVFQLQGKLVFGNYNIPTTLSVNFGEAHVMYTTKPASTPFDLFMHIIKCRAERLKVMFVNSPKYTGPVDEYVAFISYLCEYSCNNFFPGLSKVSQNVPKTS